MSENSSEAPVLTERRDNVLVITLNRPEVRNAVNKDLSDGVAAALDELDGDDSLAIAVMTGAGNGFCAGMDLKAFAAGQTPWHETRGFAGIVQQPPRKPIIAAVEGFAVAGGLEVALACDLLVAARGAKLGIPEVKRSLIAAGGALRRLPRRVPPGIAKELALTGDPISAERGYDIGLVNRLTEPGEALSRRAGAGRRDRRQRPARARRDQADPRRPVGVERGRVLGQAGRDLRPRLRLRGRARGRGRLQREARAGLAGSLVARAHTGAASAPTAVVRPRIRSAARSAIAITGALVLPRTTVGITLASQTRTPSTPMTRRSLSTTAPIAQELVGWKTVCVFAAM